MPKKPTNMICTNALSAGPPTAWTDNGIIAFITNRSYIDSRQDDGFRQVVLDEFSDLYIIDLGGDIRKGRPAGNIFGIMTGVAIGFLVKSAARNDDAGIHYHTLTDSHSGPAKLAELQQLDFASIPFRDITPDANANWLNHSSNRFASLMPIASKQTKFAKSHDDEKAVFALFTNGSKSNRDAWVYDFDADNLRRKDAILCQHLQRPFGSRRNHIRPGLSSGAGIVA